MNPNDILKDIRALTAELISAGLCVDQNFPIIEKTEKLSEIHFGKFETISATLKNVPYSESYTVLRESRAFNMCLIDGGLIQIMYKFQDEKIFGHRLAFFPCPDLLEYQNHSEVYENDELYGDVIHRNIVTTPIRFDYDPENAIDYDHPACHMTIGQYKNCRIPVYSPISPFLFMNFILRSFYNTPFRKFCGNIKEKIYKTDPTVTVREQRHMHLHIGEVA